MIIRKKVGMLLAVAACMAVIGTGSAVCAEDTISQGVFVNDTDVSGMTYAEAEKIVEQKVAEFLSSTINVQVGEDNIDATAVDLGLQWKNRDIVEQAMGMGNSGNFIKRYKETKDLTQEPQKLTLSFSANDERVRSFVEEKCKQFEKEPQDASISSDGGGGFNLEAGVTGQVINVDESVKIIEDYVADEWQGGQGSVAIAVELEEPKGNTEDLEQIQDLLGTFTTYYSGTYGRNTNVERGAELINDHVVWPGDTFSVCDHLVPFSAENGYELGGEYAAGRVVQGYGGGICQVSTTLYNALLLAEVDIIERHCHTMSVSYVSASMDAAIAEGNMDLVFQNNSDTPIFISGYAYGGELTFSVYGKETRPADRQVYYEPEVTGSVPAPTGTNLVANPDQPMGYINQVQAAVSGMTAVLYKYVTYNGETTVEQVNSSSYEATAATYEVGTAGATDALLNAIYSGDLAAVQLAATGVTQQSETQQSETTADGINVLTDPSATLDIPDTTGGVIDTPTIDGQDTYTGDGTGDDVVTW